MAYKWERCPRCGTARVDTRPGWLYSIAIIFVGVIIALFISSFVDDKLMEHPIILGIFILTILISIILGVLIARKGSLSSCKDCNYSWTPKKIYN